MKDLSQLTAAELQAELHRRNQQKESDRKAYKNLVNQHLGGIVQLIIELSEQMSNVKLFTFTNLRAILDMKLNAYEVKDTQKSHTFTDDKGNSITYGFRVIDGWDDSVTAGIEKVRNFIASLAKDEATAKLVHAVNQLLKKDAKGNLKASRVLELTK